MSGAGEEGRLYFKCQSRRGSRKREERDQSNRRAGEKNHF